MRNQSTDFPVLACAVSLVDGEYRASIGARPGRAIIVRDDNGLLADGVNSDTAAAFAKFVSENVPTESNVRGSAEYRTHLTKGLTKRALTELGGM
jgi:CO/xanthine dehydrogenase FAD-binding subunit